MREINETRLEYIIECAASSIKCIECPVWFGGFCEGHLDGEGCLDHLWGYLNDELT